jgi:hypothetical protein
MRTAPATATATATATTVESGMAASRSIVC